MTIQPLLSGPEIKPPVSICLLHKLPTPYNDVLFRCLNADSGINLQVYHLWRGSWRRPWKSELGLGYPNKYMSLRFGIDWKLAYKAFKEKNTFFVIGDWGHLVSVVIILIRLVRHWPVALWVDTPQETLPRSFLKRHVRSLLLDFILPRVDIVFGTGAQALQVLESLGVPRARLVNLPCFIDLNSPVNARKDPECLKKAHQFRELVGCGGDGVVFSMIGTLTLDIKGQDLGLQAFAMCRAECQKPVGLLIAGDGPDRERLHNLANELNLGQSVAFLGWQEPDGMDAVYEASDVVIHPSRLDRYPLVVLETMSWSKVIVGSNVCGSIADRVQSGINGFSFQSEAIADLAKIMIALANDPGLRATVGARARISADEWPPERGVEVLRECAISTIAAHSSR